MSNRFTRFFNKALIEGTVEGIAGNTLRGWAWMPGHPDEAVSIEVRVNDALIATVDCNLFRTDLADAQKRSGYCAFEVPVDSGALSGKSVEVIARARQKRQALPGGSLRISAAATAPIQPDRSPVSVLPIPIVAESLTGFLDQCGPDRVRGWAHRTNGIDKPLVFSLCESDQVLLTIEPNQWRSDIAELRSGDGCCGFDLALPAVLRDGQLHHLQLRVADTGKPALAAPFTIQIPKVQKRPARTTSAAALPQHRGPAECTLSIIVNFYNMQREAARTLTSLGRQYQLGSDDLDYEVLCIDNGSSPPMDPDWIAGFGPQYRLIRPSAQHASPCFAINEAASKARGRYLAIMIDGAHLLTPGIFHEAVKAWKEDADSVVAIRHWFVGGDQRWLASAGYTRSMEDKLFERIRWPTNGYEMFRIAAPIGESPEPWFDGLSESNCLMLPTQLYDRIGGMDEAFSHAGGGFANLDLWRRAREAASGPLISLIGEATFHQFHGGTTTNVEDAEKDARVRAYANEYLTLRGREYESAHRSTLTFRGHMPSEFATGIRQRTLLPLRMGITGEVRRGQMPLHFDEGAQSYLQSVYAECGLQETVTWMGKPTGVAPADMQNIQDIIHELHPDAIIMVGASPGLIHYVDSLLQIVSDQPSRILAIAPTSNATIMPRRCTVLPGRSDDNATIATARHWTGSAEKVVVLHATQPAECFSVTSLLAYGSLVSYRSYLACLGTVFGQPWLGYSSHQHLSVIQDFIQGNPRFVIDRHRDQQMLSTSPSGYLRKVGGAMTASLYDASLDDLGQPLLESSL
jgi:cephalosporin hydroxylase